MITAMQQRSDLEYVGFWLRVLAAIVDSILVVVLTMPLLRLVYGRATDLTGPDFADHPIGFLVEWVLPAAAVIVFWMARQATPGKMVISARIVDARTGAKPSVGQAIVRYLGYYVSLIPFGLGLIWVGLDRRKQGWHDKLAGTVVVRPRRGAAAEPVQFASG
jgi:uncharacterized RDD family membrane protein YckC